ncbi:MAG: sigma-70 family RNA polymerase sigma factor, partial [Candidatus Thiodiazotropha sp.]
TIRAPANAIRKQYAQLQPKLYRLAWSWCQNSEDAQDLVQETWIKALERSNQLRDREKLLQWMSRIMVNIHRDNQRRRHNDTTLDQLDLPSQDITIDTIDRHEEIQRVQQAVAQLPLDQRMVLTLVDLMEFSYAEVAETLALPIGTVMSRLSRSRRKLRLALTVEKQAQKSRELWRVK